MESKKIWRRNKGSIMDRRWDWIEERLGINDLNNEWGLECYEKVRAELEN
jgi:hypothetical protein